MFKRSAKIIGFCFGALIFALFFKITPAKAADADIVLNEVMVDPSCPYDRCEWLELRNNGNEAINIKNWTIDESKKILTDTIIAPNDYLVITKNLLEFNKVYSVDPSKVIELTTLSLSNAGHTLKLSNPTSSYEETFTYTEAPGVDLSWEKIDPLVENDSNWHASLYLGGTPAAKNSVTDLSPPEPPTLLSPSPEQELTEQNPVFLWSHPQPNLTFELIVSQNGDLSDPLLDEKNLTTLTYQATDLDYSQYYWQVIASNGLYATSSLISPFKIIAPQYCDQIIINEILPKPSTGATNEWIELYNNSSDEVNLKNWALEDLAGSTHHYVIDIDLIIPPRGYVVIFRAQSGITLNDAGDGVALYQPNGNLLYQTPVFDAAHDDLAWARGPDGNWTWTTTLTPGAENKITSPSTSTQEESSSSSTSSETNQEPIEIASGDYQQYQNRLVRIRGEVVDTNGNTFFLDDGSGEAKIYIQAKTGIDKPAMHKGDIFEIIGIVDLYGESNWRILPRRQDDIKLISLAEKTVKASTAKATSKKASAKVKTASATSTPKKVAGTLANNNSNKNDSASTPWWIELIESLLGLAIIGFIYFLIILRRRPKEQVIGGHFGDDT